MLALASHSSCEFIVKKCGRSGPYREVCNIFWRMLNRKAPEIDALGRGVYSSAEALRLINFSCDQGISRRNVSGQTISVSWRKRHRTISERNRWRNHDHIAAAQDAGYRLARSDG